MAAHTWELERDLTQARLRKDPEGMARIESAIREFRASCSHVESPEVRDRCYKCGESVGAARKAG